MLPDYVRLWQDDEITKMKNAAASAWLLRLAARQRSVIVFASGSGPTCMAVGEARVVYQKFECG